MTGEGKVPWTLTARSPVAIEPLPLLVKVAPDATQSRRAVMSARANGHINRSHRILLKLFSVSEESKVACETYLTMCGNGSCPYPGYCSSKDFPIRPRKSSFWGLTQRSSL